MKATKEKKLKLVVRSINNGDRHRKEEDKMKIDKKCLWIFVLLISLVLIPMTSCKEAEATEVAKPEKLPYIRLYSDSSPFNQKIPTDAEVDPNSDVMLQSLKDAFEEGEFYIALKEWTVPVYFADENTPRYDVKLTANWALADFLKDVPIPDFAEPDPQEDGEMAIIDTSTGCEYDFWQAKKESGKWLASWANAIPYEGDGIYPKGMSCRGAGFALLAGVIWPQELEEGKIEHALHFSYTFPKSGGPVLPATESDGWSDRDDAIPEGARLQLDPNLDLESLNLQPFEKTIAQALQEYGMILGDVGGAGIELEAIHPMSVQNNLYEGILPDDVLVYLSNIPIDRFRVLKLPPQTDPEIDLVPNRCTSWGE